MRINSGIAKPEEETRHIKKKNDLWKLKHLRLVNLFTPKIKYELRFGLYGIHEGTNNIKVITEFKEKKFIHRMESNVEIRSLKFRNIVHCPSLNKAN